MLTINKRLALLVSVVVVILLIPMVAMQFTNEVNWTLSDFMVAGILLFGVITIIEIILRITKKQQYRTLLIIGILAVALLLWMELAVGIFGSPIAGS